MSVRKAKGFTILELMITVLIAALIAAFAVPAFRDMLARNRINAISNEVVDALALARNKAVTSRRQVVIQPTGAGWTTYLDSVLAANAIGAIQFASPLDITFPVSNPTSVTFEADGRVQNSTPTPSTPLVNWTVQICDSSIRDEVGKDVILSRIGRVSVRRHASATTCNP